MACPDCLPIVQWYSHVTLFAILILASVLNDVPKGTCAFIMKLRQRLAGSFCHNTIVELAARCLFPLARPLQRRLSLQERDTSKVFCKTKRQYLLIFQVSRYCLLALLCKTVAVGCCLADCQGNIHYPASFTSSVDCPLSSPLLNLFRLPSVWICTGHYRSRGSAIQSTTRYWAGLGQRWPGISDTCKVMSWILTDVQPRRLNSPG